MRHLPRVLSIVILLFLTLNQGFAQCEPDPECVDTGDPGEICPTYLPDGKVGEAYSTIVTVVVPDTISYDGTSVEIAFFLVDSVNNMPMGIGWYPNSDTLWGGSAHCIEFSGTPEEAGTFPLGIYITPYLNTFLGLFKWEQIVNDTSVVFTVEQSSNLESYAYKGFYVMQNNPNPFTNMTRLGFYTPKTTYMSLQVYSILGKLVHEERKGFAAGEHFFEYDGSSLQPGTYFYRVSNMEEIITGKFVKSCN